MTAAILDDRAAGEQPARQALAAGDHRRALDLLLRQYGTVVYGYCRRVVRDPDLAEDLLQTTFLQAYGALSRFDGRSTLRTWLFGIAHHRCLDALKARQRWWRRLSPLDETHDAAQPGDLESSAIAVDLRRVLDGCLERLAARARTAVLLRFFEGYSYAEMADICRERAPTLQARVVRALPLLRRCVQAKGVTL